MRAFQGGVKPASFTESDWTSFRAEANEGVKPTFYTLRTKLMQTRDLTHESVKSRFDPILKISEKRRFDSFLVSAPS